MRARFQDTQTGIADANGNITLKFTRPPIGYAKIGSVFPVVSNPSGANVPARAFGALWTVLLNNIPVCTFQGLQGAVDVQGWDTEYISLQGVNVVPGSKVQATWNGYSDKTMNLDPVQPYITGDAGTPTSLLSPFIALFVGGPQGINISAPVFLGSSNQYAYILGYTLSVSLNQKGEVTGSRSMTATITFITGGLPSGSIEQLVPTTTTSTTPTAGMVGTVSNQTISRDLSNSPLAIGTSQQLNLITGPSGASAAEATCTLVMALVP